MREGSHLRLAMLERQTALRLAPVGVGSSERAYEVSPAEDLGATVQRYVTDNNRRGRTALVALLIGVIAMGVGLPLVIAYVSAHIRQFNPAPGMALGLGILSLWWSIFCGLGYFRRRGETFTVCEGGLVHDYAGKTCVIAWNEIAKVRDRGKDGPINRALGFDVYCRIKLTGGGKLIITGFTQGSRQLAQIVEQAVHHGTRPSRPENA